MCFFIFGTFSGPSELGSGEACRERKTGGAGVGGSRKPLGSTTLRNQLLRAWGFTVVTVSYHEWERAGTAEGKRRHVGELLERATRAREEED